MMLWISSISGSPESSIPTSFSTGIRRSPNASNCSRESQISLTRRFPFDLKATWYASPSGSQSPDFSRRLRVSSYCSVVTSEAGVKRARIAVLRASMIGVADGLVAIHGLLRVVAPDRADLQPNASCCARLAGEDSGPESTRQRITLLVRRRRVLPSDDHVLLQGGIYSVERRCRSSLEGRERPKVRSDAPTKCWPCGSNSVCLGSSPRAPNRVGCLGL